MISEKSKFDWFVFYYYIFFAVLGWFTLLSVLFMRLFVLETEGSLLVAALRPYRFYTMQTNLLVNLWNTFYLIWYNKEKGHKGVMNWLHGAITLYISVTFLVYAVVLAGLYTPPTPFDNFVVISTHYIIPISAIIGWILSGRKIQYKWKYLVIWIIYPCIYLVFAVIHGTFTGDYLYPFLNIDNLGVGSFFISVLVLICIYLLLGSIYIIINRKGAKNGKI